MKTFTLNHEEVAKSLATSLIELSIAFSCTPLPEGEYEITVKDDVAHVASQALSDLYEDFEVIGIDNDGCVVHWDAQKKEGYNTGVKLNNYNRNEFTKKEEIRLKLTKE